MESKEITLDELQSKTGFTKKQIYNWREKGLIPEPVRRERTGRMAGEIVYYPIEAYYRLRSIMHFPVSSVTKKIGVDGLFLPLFLYGFRDEKIDEGIKRLFKKAIRHFRKEFLQAQKNMTLEELSKNNKGDNLFFSELNSIQPPTEMALPLFSRLAGKPKKEIKDMLPEETSDERYDSIFLYASKLGEEMGEKIGVTSYDGFFEEDFLKVFRKLTLTLPSFPELIKRINRLNKKELNEIQLGMQMTLGISNFFGLKIYALEVFRKTHSIYEFCMDSLLHFFIFPLISSKLKPEVKEVINKTLEGIRNISYSEDKVKEKRRRKKLVD